MLLVRLFWNMFIVFSYLVSFSAYVRTYVPKFFATYPGTDMTCAAVTSQPIMLNALL